MATDIVNECQAGVLRGWGSVNVLRPPNPRGIRITRKNNTHKLVKWDLGQFGEGAKKKKVTWRPVLRKKIFCSFQGTNELCLRMPTQPKPKCPFHSGESREEIHFSLLHYQNWKTVDFKSQKFFKLNKMLSSIFFQ